MYKDPGFYLNKGANLIVYTVCIVMRAKHDYKADVFHEIVRKSITRRKRKRRRNIRINRA